MIDCIIWKRFASARPVRQPVTLCLAAIALLAALHLASFKAMAQEDREITDQSLLLAVVTELLLDEAVPAHYLDVEARDGIITLSGKVSNILARDRAVYLARSVKSVRSVIDRIAVTAVERSDANLREDVARSLAEDPATDSFEITVDAADGVITLIGTVDSRAEKQLAATVAKGVRGVREIRNDVAIEYREVRPDDEIAADIRRRMELDAYLDPMHVEMEVTGGEVKLAGTVGSAVEKQRAFENASVAGVTDVDISGLEVRLWAEETYEKKDIVTSPADAQVRQAVEDALRFDPRVTAFDIAVEADGGTVTLTGLVDNLKAKRAAEEDARNTAGVRRVRNYIRVRMQEPPEDEDIHARVQEALARDPILAGHDIDIQVHNQGVILDGTVDSYYQKYHAQDVAFRVVGVAAVDNNLDVTGEWEWKSDRDLKADIEDQLFWSAYVNDQKITVEVENGVVTRERKVR